MFCSEINNTYKQRPRHYPLHQITLYSDYIPFSLYLFNFRILFEDAMSCQRFFTLHAFLLCYYVMNKFFLVSLCNKHVCHMCENMTSLLLKARFWLVVIYNLLIERTVEPEYSGPHSDIWRNEPRIFRMPQDKG